MFCFSPFSTLNRSCFPPLACNVRAEKSAYSHIEIPLYATLWFFLAVFRIVSLSLTFVILITVCLGVYLFQLILFGTLCFLYLVICFLLLIWEVFSHNFIKYILTSLPFFFSSVTTIIPMLVHVMFFIPFFGNLL